MARISTLRDDLEDNTLDPAKWVVWTAGGLTTVAETSGQVEVTVAENSTGVHYAYYASAASFDVAGGSVYVEVPAVASGSLHGNAVRGGDGR